MGQHARGALWPTASQTGSLASLAKCDRPGWYVEKGVCYVKPASDGTYGWRLLRIKIKGEITAERLAEALARSSRKYEAVRPGHKVYGANLYLTAFDADGLPFDLVDHRGEPLSITIEAKSGELVKPALTAG